MSWRSRSERLPSSDIPHVVQRASVNTMPSQKVIAELVRVSDRERGDLLLSSESGRLECRRLRLNCYGPSGLVEGLDRW